MKIKVRAADVQPGDRLLWDSVVVGASSGARTPAGHIEVVFKTKRGDLRQSCWRRGTLVTVERGA